MFHLCFPDHLLHIFRLVYKYTFSVHSDFVKGVCVREIFTSWKTSPEYGETPKSSRAKPSTTAKKQQTEKQFY